MRRALLVGINDYPSAPLSGCVNDANAMERLLRRHDDGRVNFDTQILTSDLESVTRARLREGLEDLFADPAEVALLYFSGHGTENDLGGYLVTSDATAYEEGVSLGDVLAHANRATHITEVAIIIDSCHSGWLGTVPAINNMHASLREGLSILSASRSSQASLEEGEHGVFTELVCSALDAEPPTSWATCRSRASTPTSIRPSARGTNVRSSSRMCRACSRFGTRSRRSTSPSSARSGVVRIR